MDKGELGSRGSRLAGASLLGEEVTFQWGLWPHLGLVRDLSFCCPRV